MTMRHAFLLFTVGAFCSTAYHADAEDTRVLLLTKSSTFIHSVIAERKGQPSHVTTVLGELGKKHDFVVTSTKDASRINAADLENFDVVIFYTTGDLTISGGTGTGMFKGDGEPAMGANGVAELREWVKNGGGFIGLHSGADTFHGDGKTLTPYLDLLGAEFVVHGMQFEGTMRVTDKDHPTMKGVPETITCKEEWYTFDLYDTPKIHVLAMMEPGEIGARQTLYDIPDYPIAWCRGFGEGRSYYQGMGHRKDVWTNKAYQRSVVNAIHWAAGDGPLDADANFAEVVNNDE